MKRVVLDHLQLDSRHQLEVALGRHALDMQTNLTMRQLAPLFCCSPATVCRVISGAAAAARDRAGRSSRRCARAAVERGWHPRSARDRKTECPRATTVLDQRVGGIIDADSRVVIAATRPVPGNTSDAWAWRNSGPAQRCEGMTVPAEGTHIGSGLAAPHRKRPGRALLPGEEAGGTEHRQFRGRVEHAFARVKHYKVLRDRREYGNGLHLAVLTGARIHNLALAACPDRPQTRLRPARTPPSATRFTARLPDALEVRPKQFDNFGLRRRHRKL
ncbi:transposase family protein [Streptomyces sp. NPDC057027]|uniref:transposase family protein n=1 Tax=Streptomyces sp. NPDC057027 TaxID=3346004 RepID=UPI003643F020